MKISHLPLDTFLAETSTSLPLFKGLPGGDTLLKALHKQFQLDPEQRWEPIKKIDWKELKGGDSSRRRWGRGDFEGNWVIMSTKDGAAGIRHDGSKYTVVTATPDGKVEDENFSSSKGALDFIKRNFGLTKLLSSKAKMYMGSIRQSGKAPTTSSYRRELELTPVGYSKWKKQIDQYTDPETGRLTGSIGKGGTSGSTMTRMTGPQLAAYRKKRGEERKAIEQSSPEKLLQRFKPLWLRAATAALKDINGITQTMAKSGAYDRLKDKIDKNISPLQKAIEQLETGQGIDTERYYYGNSPKGYFIKAINRACALAAVYYYPDDTGNVSASGTPDNPQGLATLMSDIDRGDMTKLKTVLDFFKQELMRATS